MTDTATLLAQFADRLRSERDQSADKLRAAQIDAAHHGREVAMIDAVLAALKREAAK